jgi:hypothetical protein
VVSFAVKHDLAGGVYDIREYGWKLIVSASDPLFLPPKHLEYSV